MENIIVEVKASHLRGNSWEHKMNPSQRFCPLHEALQEKYPGASVGGTLVTIDHRMYEIDTKVWGVWSVEELIKKANGGSEEPFLVTLKPLEF